ncbi:MAG: hypothetical protein ACKVP7_04800 [Hyphomicrobiaceae bacterium]
MTAPLAVTDNTIPLLLLGLLGFAIAYHLALDYPWLVAIVALGIVLLTIGVFDPAAWGHKAEALARAPQDGPPMMCGRWRSYYDHGWPCHLEAPPHLVLLGLLFGAFAALGGAVYWKTADPLPRGMASLLVTLGVPGIVAVILYPHVHPTWAFGHPLLLAALGALTASAPEVPRMVRNMISDAKEERERAVTPPAPLDRAALQDGAAGAGYLVSQLLVMVRSCLRNIRHKGLAAATGLAGVALAGSLLPASASSPALVLVFPAAFFAGLTLWIIVEACLIEPGHWD